MLLISDPSLIWKIFFLQYSVCTYILCGACLYFIFVSFPLYFVDVVRSPNTCFLLSFILSKTPYRLLVLICFCTCYPSIIVQNEFGIFRLPQQLLCVFPYFPFPSNFVPLHISASRFQMEHHKLDRCVRQLTIHNVYPLQ
uniref:Uncharacterized protein n=1 Tax=Rhizophora mucronata TaxID=61149 RepID=A0A2P2QXW2_RHIMU